MTLLLAVGSGLGCRTGAQAGPAVAAPVRPPVVVAPETPSIAEPVRLVRPKVQFIGVAAADGIRLRWTVAGTWLPPGGFRLLRKAPGAADFVAVGMGPIRPRGDRQIGVIRAGDAAGQRAFMSVEQLLRGCELPAEARDAAEREVAELNSVPRYRVQPPQILSAREVARDRLIEMMPSPPSPEWVQAERQRLANLATQSPAAAALRGVQRARTLALTLSNTNWGMAGDLGLGYTDAEAQARQTYEYRIEMLGADGQPMAGYDVEPSPTVRVTAGADLAPPPPTDFRAEPGNRQVAFHWKRPEGKNRDGLEVGKIVAHYNVYRSDSKTGPEARVNDLPVVIIYTPTKDVPGRPSAMVAPRVIFFDRPADREPASALGGGAVFDPTQVTADALQEIVGGAAANAQQRSTVGDLVNGTQYWYSVEAVDVFGRVSARTARVAARPFARPLPPLLGMRRQRQPFVPVGRRAAMGTAPGGQPAPDAPVVWNANYADDVRVQWRAPAGGQPADVQVANFHVYRVEDAPNAQPARAGRVAANVTTFIDRAPPRDRSYRYWVCAVDRWDNESVPSDALHVTLPDRTPLPTPAITAVEGPRAPAAGAGTGAREVRVTIRWSCPARPNLAGFNVYRAEARWPDEHPGQLEIVSPPVETRSGTEGDVMERPLPTAATLQATTVATLRTRVPLQLLGANMRELSDWVPAENSRTYHYEIEAVSKFGFRSPRSRRGSVRVMGRIGPSAPAAIAAVAEEEGGPQGGLIGDVTVNWTPAAAAERVVGYNVYWAPATKRGGEPDWQKVNAEPIPAGSNTRSDGEVDDRASLPGKLGAAAPPKIRPPATAATPAAGAAAVNVGATPGLQPGAVGAATAGAPVAVGSIAGVLNIPRLSVVYRHANAALRHSANYWYVVEAVDADGLASRKSNRVTVTVTKIRAAAPARAAATGMEMGIRVTWTNQDPGVRGFILERGLRAAGPFRQVCGVVRAQQQTVGAACEHLDQTVRSGIDYYYRITTLDTANNRSDPVVVGPAHRLGRISPGARPPVGVARPREGE